ncbi:MAG: glycosyltransferase family 39 protein [Chitinophagales bacterium]|nr:glycosyltransferase family 39 protein [Chitinophagales bacterium]
MKLFAFFFGAIYAVFQIATGALWGFHRDELLYLSLGRHLDWGFWSNPPFIGLMGWISGEVLGGSLIAAHVLPALAGGAIAGLGIEMIRAMGGGRYAQLLGALAMCCSLALLRSASMLQPVIFDWFFWTLTLFLSIKWLKTAKPGILYAMAIVVGLGLLNKYTVAFLAVLLPLAVLFGPERKALLTLHLAGAAGLALLVFLPNLYWQWAHEFPVITHMRELRETQLENVNPVAFLVDQLLMNGSALLVWLPGLWWLWQQKQLRYLSVFAVLMLLTLLLLKGKSYYCLGIYMPLIAGGACFWEEKLSSKLTKLLLPLLLLLLALPLLPLGKPFLKPAAMQQKIAGRQYLEGAVRWEDGRLHPLPQDYADMLGWESLARHADAAADSCGAEDSFIIYAENYGQAGAVAQYARIGQHKAVYSFSDAFRLWIPDTLPAQTQTLIYINDELGADVQALFSNIQVIGGIDDTLAREHGTRVWLCRAPKSDFPTFWKNRVSAAKAE